MQLFVRHNNQNINLDDFIDILRKYNPELTGFSIKTGGENSLNAALNVAVSGAKSKSGVNLPTVK